MNSSELRNRCAVCPGSFDPVTLGHIDIFSRAAQLFDSVIVLVTYNPKKIGLFSPDERVDLIRESTKHIPGIIVDAWSGLLVDYTTRCGAHALVKGLRSSLDYEYELPMAQVNQRLSGVDTVFLMTNPHLGYVSSSLCKQVAHFGGDVTTMVPPAVAKALTQRA